MKTNLLIAFILLINTASAQWSRISNSPANANRIYFYNSSLGYVLKSNDIYKTTNGGASWNNTIAGFNSFMTINDIRFVSPDTGFISVTDGSTFSYPTTIYITTNGGLAWNSLLGPFNSGDLDFHLSGQNNWYFYLTSGGSSTLADTIYHTTNGGTTWTKTGNVTSVQYNQLINNLTIYEISGGSSSMLYRSSNGGATWNLLLTDNTISAAFVDHQFLNANNGYALLYQYNPNDNIPSMIYKTSDGGQTWLHYNLPAACSGPQNLHFTDVNTGYIVSNDPTQGSLFKTTDGGQTWSPDFPAQANEYFASSHGIWEYFGTLYMLGNNVISNKVVTSVKDLKKDKLNFNLFPNPSKGELIITSSSQEKDKKFVITDLMGREIYAFAMEQDLQQKIDLTFLECGIYFLKNNETAQTILFVKE